MRIFNIMLSRSLGGIQQCYLDYSAALTMQNNEVVNISSYEAEINKKLDSHYKLPNYLSWCLISKIKLRYLIWKHKPDIIISHGNRAINFARFLRNKDIKLVGVSHNYSYKYLKKCDYVLTLTDKLKQHLIRQEFPDSKCLPISNMLRTQKEYKKPNKFGEIITIGSVGRFVKKKGFSDLINSISILKNQGHKVQLLLGGNGPEEESLKKQVNDLELQNEIKFLGWVEDMDAFWPKIDIFCLPSIEEPFGIIVLEAMQASKPVISTKSGGPNEIIRHKQDGLLTNINSPTDLAENIAKIIQNPESASSYTKNAYCRLKNNYDIKIVAKKLDAVLKNL